MSVNNNEELDLKVCRVDLIGSGLIATDWSMMAVKGAR